MKITTPAEFAAARLDRNAPRPIFVDMLCINIERELARDCLNILVTDYKLYPSEIEAAADRYRAAGWTVKTDSTDFTICLIDDTDAAVAEAAKDMSRRSHRDPDPVPMILHCPWCGDRHLDVGEIATKIHHTHVCQSCGEVWRPAVVPTVGVQFLPGFRNPEF